MNRDTQINQLIPDKIWDFIVIGGGASGLGAVVDAASRGFESVLFEGSDFAKGTSSRSTKLVHGGVRYLAQGDVGLVREALRERGLIAQNAKHLFKDQDFIIPTYTLWEKLYYGIGLKIYDWLSWGWSLGSSKWIKKRQAKIRLPNLKNEGLSGGVVYKDGQFDDSRLALNLAQTAHGSGATVINYMRVTAILKDAEGEIKGVEVEDQESGKIYEVLAKVVINATGVFSNKILKMDDRKANELRVVPSQGIHLVVDEDFLGSDQALMIPKTTDGRVLFAIPWHGKTILGTTDTLIRKPSYEPRPKQEEIDFILDNAGKYMSRVPRREDVKSVFVGLRPLVAPKKDKMNTKEISRGHKILTSPSGLITILGGKWTTYRSMGEELIDQAIKIHGLNEIASASRQLAIYGNPNGVELPSEERLQIYGSAAIGIKDLEIENPALTGQLHPSYPYTRSQVVWAVRHEMARTVEDFLARRIRLLFLDAKAAQEASREVALIMAEELDRDENWIAGQLEEFTKLSQGYLLS